MRRVAQDDSFSLMPGKNCQRMTEHLQSLVKAWDMPHGAFSIQIDQSQQGQRAQHVWNHARIHDHSQRCGARDGRMPGLMFLVNEFVDQDDDRAGEGHDATRPGPRVDPAEQEVHREKAAPRREEDGQHDVDEGGQGQLPESCCWCVRNGVHRFSGLRLCCGLCERVLAVATHAGPSFEE